MRDSPLPLHRPAQGSRRNVGPQPCCCPCRDQAQFAVLGNLCRVQASSHCDIAGVQHSLVKVLYLWMLEPTMMKGKAVRILTTCSCALRSFLPGPCDATGQDELADVSWVRRRDHTRPKEQPAQRYVSLSTARPGLQAATSDGHHPWIHAAVYFLQSPAAGPRLRRGCSRRRH